METQTNQTENKTTTTGGWRSTLVFFWDIFKILVLALAVILPFRLFVAEPFVVSGSSMLPNYHNHDYLIIDRWTYRSHQPERGDVIVLKFPRDPSQYYIKRIIGLPGEQVKVQNGGVYIFNDDNPGGFRLEEPYLKSTVETIGSNQTTSLGSGEYFVLGDNRTGSSDSRVWGILPEANIVGKVWLKAFPLKDFGLFQAPAYTHS